MSTKFCYDQKRDEFVEVSPGQDEPTGNRVVITGKTPNVRFNVQINGFGHVLAAFNRLVLKYIPTFQWPENKQ